MAQVHDNGMVAHLWAHGTQESARSNNGNFSFDGDTIYSYSTPIGKIHTVAGQRVALVTSQTFSMTTEGKHKNAIHKATNYGRFIPQFVVPSIGASGGRLSERGLSHETNMAYFVAQYEAEKKRLRRARDLYQPVEDSLERFVTPAREYSEAFGIDAPVMNYLKDALEIAAYRDERETRNSSPEAAAKREKARLASERRKAEKERIEALAKFERESEMRARWLDGGSIWGATLRTENGGALLRVKGGNLETSISASVPLDHAIKAFRFIKLVRERGEPWARNGKTVRVGHFQVDSIAANGDIHAGCHFIEWSEIERVATEIGVFEQAASADAVEPSHHAA